MKIYTEINRFRGLNKVSDGYSCEIQNSVCVCREMRKKKGGNDDGRRTKWPPLDVETRRRRGQIICRRWDVPPAAGTNPSAEGHFHLLHLLFFCAGI